MLKNISKEEISLLYIIGSLTIPYAWCTYLAALLGIFTFPVLSIGTFISSSLLLWFGRAHLTALSRRQHLSIGIALCIGLFVILFMHPGTFYTGRDQGAIATAALLLAEHSTPYTTAPAVTAFFDIYGPGQALNFPGFHYSTTGNLISQFPLPYIAFLGGFATVFGPLGLPIANGILIMSFFALFGSLVRIYTRDFRYEYIGYLLLATSFPLLWFARYTLSENLAILLLWFAYALFLILSNRSRETSMSIYILFLLVVSLLFFVRIEGFWFLCAFLILVLSHNKLRTWIFHDLFPRLILPATLFFSTALLAFIISWPFYKTLGAIFVQKSSDALSAGSVSTDSSLTSFFYPAFHAYGITVILLVIVITLICGLRSQKRRLHFFPLLLITVPLFFYFLEPHISADHPWMLRRYVFWLIPLYVGSALFLWYQIAQRTLLWQRFGMITLSLFIIMQAQITLPYIIFRDHSNLNDSTSLIAQNFTARDLLLIDGLSTGDGWAMLPGPLMTQKGLQAVYFFNAIDYAKIDTTKFERIFLISSAQNEAHFQDLIDQATPYDLVRARPSDKHLPALGQIQTRHLSIEHDRFTALPQKTMTTTPISAYQLK